MNREQWYLNEWKTRDRPKQGCIEPAQFITQAIQAANQTTSAPAIEANLSEKDLAAAKAKLPATEDFLFPKPAGFGHDHDLIQSVYWYGRSPAIELKNMQEALASAWVQDSPAVVYYDPLNRVPSYMPASYNFSGAMNPAAAPAPPEELPEDVLIGTIVGWREWNAPLFGGPMRSLNGTKWEPGKRMEAECAQERICKGVPCGCGIYAYRQQARIMNAAGFRMKNLNLCTVIGEVSLWGLVLECTNGYRAQYAYPKSFINTGAAARRMAELYRVPLREEKQ